MCYCSHKDHRHNLTFILLRWTVSTFLHSYIKPQAYTYLYQLYHSLPLQKTLPVTQHHESVCSVHPCLHCWTKQSPDHPQIETICARLEKYQYVFFIDQSIATFILKKLLQLVMKIKLLIKIANKDY